MRIERFSREIDAGFDDSAQIIFKMENEIDEKYDTPYHGRFKNFVAEMQRHNYVIGGAMTDVKGDGMLMAKGAITMIG